MIQPTTTSPIIFRRWSRFVRRGQVAAEQVAEGVLVGDLEDAVGADDEVDVQRVDVGAELPRLPARGQQRVQPGHDGRRQSPQRADLPDELAPVDVLDRHQADEVGMLAVMVVGQLGQLPEGVDGRQVADGIWFSASRMVVYAFSSTAR